MKLVFHSSTITMMHGPINIRFINVTSYLPDSALPAFLLY